jgi:hypothetical protein
MISSITKASFLPSRSQLIRFWLDDPAFFSIRGVQGRGRGFQPQFSGKYEQHFGWKVRGFEVQFFGWLV